MKKKLNKEVDVSYRSLGEFVRQRRKSLGYTSIDKFALANGIDKTYIVRLENGKQFGSPESFVAVAKALGVTPGFLMDIFAEIIDFEGNSLITETSINLPENFTSADKQLLVEFIAFLNYRRQLEVEIARFSGKPGELQPESAQAQATRNVILSNLIAESERNKKAQQEQETEIEQEVEQPKIRNIRASKTTPSDAGR